MGEGKRDWMRQTYNRYLRTSLIVVRYRGGYVLLHPGSSVTLLTDVLGARAAIRLIRGQSASDVCAWAEARLPGAGARVARLVDRLDTIGAITSGVPRHDLRWHLRRSLSLLAGPLLTMASLLVPYLPVVLLRALLTALPYTPLVARTVGQIEPYVSANLQASGYAHTSASWRQSIARSCAAASARTFFAMYLALVLPPRKLLRLTAACFDLESFATLERVLRESDGAVLACLHTSAYIGFLPLLHAAGWETVTIADVASLSATVGSDPLAGLSIYHRYTTAIVDSRAPMSGRALLKHVLTGKLATIAFDVPPSESGDAARMPTISFLGRRLYRFDGPAWLALHSGKPIVFTATYQRGHRTAIYTRPPLLPAPNLPRQSRVADLSARLYEAGETFLRAHPDAWMAWCYLHDLVAPEQAAVEHGECQDEIEPVPTR